MSERLRPMNVSYVPVAGGDATKLESPYYTIALESQDDSDHDDLQQEKGRIAGILRWFNLSTGWRRGILYCIATSFFVLSSTLVFTGWASTHLEPGKGVAVIFQGTCRKSKIISLASHIYINALSTLLLGSSNYCMHILSAPSRRDIDRLHACKTVLDIGINSISNMFKLSWKNRILWCMLGLSSLPLHLISNSTVYASTTAYTYTAAVVTPGFLNGDTWKPNPRNNPQWVPPMFNTVSGSLQPPTGWLDQVQNGQIHLTPLEKKACVTTYDQFFMTSNANVILVIEKNNSRVADCFNSSVLRTYLGAYNYSDSHSRSTWMSYNWLCTNDGDAGEYAGVPACSGLSSGSLPFTYSLDLDRTNNFSSCGMRHKFDKLEITIDSCLSQKVEERCTVEANIYFLSIVIAFISSKAIIMLWMLKFLQEKPLVVLGDAIASFVSRPDSATVGACLGPPSMFRHHNNWQGVREWQPRPRKWAAAASVSQWMVCLGLCSLAIAAAITLFVGALHGLSETALKRSEIGAINPSFMMTNIVKGKGDSASSILSAVLLANTPQLIISLIYISYNSVWTSMLMGLEWSQYAYRRRGLRVSYPKGEQRSTYRLQIPYRYGTVLMTLIGTLHWLISQSIFLVRVRVVSAEGVEDVDGSIITCGYSLQALLATIVVGGVAVLAIVGFGCRSYEPIMTLVKCNSAAISAACHAVPEQGHDDGVALGLLQWGAVPSASDVGHCCFSKAEVLPPELGRLYM